MGEQEVVVATTPAIPVIDKPKPEKSARKAKKLAPVKVEFNGRIVDIAVANDADGTQRCSFALKGKKGQREEFQISSTMVQVASMAFSKGLKVHVKLSGEGTPKLVAQISVHAKK